MAVFNRNHLGLEFKSPIMKIRYYFDKKIVFKLKNDYDIQRRRKCEGSSPNSLRSISYFGSIWELYVLDLKAKVFVGKITNYIFPWTGDLQCQNSANSLAENTPNASKYFSPICLPKPKIFDFLKKELSLGVRS